jgi:hypothetical protein
LPFAVENRSGGVALMTSFVADPGMYDVMRRRCLWFRKDVSRANENFVNSMMLDTVVLHKKLPTFDAGAMILPHEEF